MRRSPAGDRRTPSWHALPSVRKRSRRSTARDVANPRVTGREGATATGIHRGARWPVSRAGAPAHLIFLALVVINLVNGFQALGTLLAVGLMILPAGIARFWSRDITGLICIAVVSALISGYAGLVLSFQTRMPSGPAIILVAAGLYMVSVLFASVGGVVRQLFPGRHLEA